MYNFGVTKWSSGVGFPTGVAQYDPSSRKPPITCMRSVSNDELDAIGEFLRSVSAEPRRTPATVAELGLSGVADEAPVPAIVIDLQVTPAAPRLEVGQALALQAGLRLSDGMLSPAQGPMQWRSMTPERVSVDGDGVLHALAVGPARVQVSTSERMLEVAVQVVDAQPDFNQGCRHPELAAGELIFVCP